MMKSNQRVTITKKMLKDGLMKLLNKKPLDKINITELCREAGINRTTFYRYYELPKDILTEMQNDFFEEIYSHIEAPISVNDIELFFSYLSDHTELVKLFFKYNTNSEADLSKVFAQIISGLPENLMPEIFRNIDENRSKLLLSYLSGGTYFLVRKWIIEDIPMQSKEVTRLVLSILNTERIF